MPRSLSASASRPGPRKHLDNVYAKLGVHTRTAAVGFVRTAGLDQDP